VLGLELGAEDVLLDGLADGDWDGIIDSKYGGALLLFENGPEEGFEDGIIYNADDSTSLGVELDL
jgi:hypothetical protein